MKQVLLLLSLSLPLAAQSERNFAFRLDNGLIVLYQTWTEVDTRKAPGGPMAFGRADARGNAIIRTLLDTTGKPVLGFTVEFERLETQRAIRVSVERHPDGAVPFFAQAPAPRNVVFGDRIFLDVLTNSSTGHVNYDRFQVGDDSTPMQILPLPGGIPRVVHTAIPLTFSGCRLTSRNTDVSGAVPSQVSVNVAVIDALGTGHFRFSAMPLGNTSRLEGIVEGSRLDFVHGRQQLVLLCRQPIVAIMKDPVYVWITTDAAAVATAR